MTDHSADTSKMVPVPRETLEKWRYLLTPSTQPEIAALNARVVRHEANFIIEYGAEPLPKMDLSTKPPNVDTSAQHVDDVDTFITRREAAQMVEDALTEFLAADVVKAIGSAIVRHERDEHGEAPTYPEDSVNDPDRVEASPENVITTSHPMPPYVVSMTDNGDGSYHVVWDNKTEADMVSVSATPHPWARGMLDLRGSVDPREGMADKPDDCVNCVNRGNCRGPNPAMKWCASRMLEKPIEIPSMCGDCLHRKVCSGAMSAIEECPDYLIGKPVEGMADLRGTVEPVQVTYSTEGYVTHAEMRDYVEKAILRALYPRKVQDDGDAE